MPLSLLPGGQSFLMTVLPYFHSVFTSTGVYRHIYLMYNWVKEFYSKGRMELHKQGTLVPAHPPRHKLPIRTLHQSPGRIERGALGTCLPSFLPFSCFWLIVLKCPQLLPKSLNRFLESLYFR